MWRRRAVDTGRAPWWDARVMGHRQLFLAAVLALLVVAVAWLAKSGIWRRGRLGLVAAAVVVALGLVARRVGLGEVAVVATLVLLPLLLLRPPAS